MRSPSSNRSGDTAAIPGIDAAARLIRDATFGRRAPTLRMGIEAELLPIDRQSGRIASMRSTILPALATFAEARHWVPAATTKGAPAFQLPAGGKLTFEPGGQIEYAAPPFESPSEALRHLRAVLGPLTRHLADGRVDLYGIGIDPFNSPDSAPLQVDTDRYRSMDQYYNRFGPAGARMMRQTASIQINIDSACEPRLVWRALNALAPILVAMFANSRRYAGRETGCANFRSRTWQMLDRTRTGLPWSEETPERHYAEFALDAPAMLNPDGQNGYRPFRDRVERGIATPGDLAAHLSTLFPEVRPRRYFEVRSVDGLPLTMYAAPIMLLAGLALEPAALSAACEILGPPDTAWLPRAARSGLSDPALASRAAEVSRLAVAVCRRHSALCQPADVDAAEDFFGRFTEQARSPADAADAVSAAATAA